MSAQLPHPAQFQTATIQVESAKKIARDVSITRDCDNSVSDYQPPLLEDIGAAAVEAAGGAIAAVDAGGGVIAVEAAGGAIAGAVEAVAGAATVAGAAAPPSF